MNRLTATIEYSEDVEFKTATAIIKAILKRSGAKLVSASPVRPPHRPKPDQTIIDRAKKMRAEGHTTEAIGLKLGISQKTASNYTREQW